MPHPHVPAVRRIRMTAAAMVLAYACARAPLPAAAAPITVYMAVDGDDSSTGKSWTEALLSLHKAAEVLNKHAPGGIVRLGAGVHTVAATATFRTPFEVRGAGPTVSVLRASPKLSYTWMILTPLNEDGAKRPPTLRGVALHDFGIDMADVDRASAVFLGFVDGVVIERCAFTNVGAQGWALHVGMLNPPKNKALTHIVNTNIAVRETTFDGLDGTLEQILVTNARGVDIRDCTFRNSAAGNAVGVYALL